MRLEPVLALGALGAGVILLSRGSGPGPPTAGALRQVALAVSTGPVTSLALTFPVPPLVGSAIVLFIAIAGPGAQGNAATDSWGNDFLELGGGGPNTMTLDAMAAWAIQAYHPGAYAITGTCPAPSAMGLAAAEVTGALPFADRLDGADGSGTTATGSLGGTAHAPDLALAAVVTNLPARVAGVGPGWTLRAQAAGPVALTIALATTSLGQPGADAPTSVTFDRPVTWGLVEVGIPVGGA